MPELDPIVARLRAAGCVFAEEEAAVLRSSARDEAELAAFVAERETGVPLEHVVGWAEFCGLRVIVEPGVFVPRPRTERLIERAREFIRTGDVVVDACCGSGAVGLALAVGEPGIRLFATDIDEHAVAVARRNIGGRGEVVVGDVLDALPREILGGVAVLTVIAPYVPTGDIPLLPHEARDFEPRLALDGGPDGLGVLARVVADAPRWLAPGGVLLTEVSEDQAPAAADLLRAADLTPEIDSDEETGSTLVLGRA
ncbi:putative protein N(5)-glutamine methyltransferase [Schumannella luteola]